MDLGNSSTDLDELKKKVNGIMLVESLQNLQEVVNNLIYLVETKLVNEKQGIFSLVEN